MSLDELCLTPVYSWVAFQGKLTEARVPSQQQAFMTFALQCSCESDRNPDFWSAFLQPNKPSFEGHEELIPPLHYHCTGSRNGEINPNLAGWERELLPSWP